MRLAAIVMASAIVASTAARADSCPQLMDEFGDALTTATANDSPSMEERATALALHDEGEALYDAGDEDQCVEKIEEALEILSNG